MISIAASSPRLFVGRDAELAALTAAAADARAGRGRCVLVTGEAGIGKTRFVEEAVTTLVRPQRVLWGRCHEPEGAPAYWPWTQALRTWMRRCPQDVLPAQLGDGAPDLAVLLPGLRERLGDLPELPRLEPEQARFRLFDAVTTVLRRAAADELLVVAIDDLQWADSESLLLLDFVAGEIGRAHLLLVGTYREIELQQATAVPRILAELARVGTRIPLGGLGESDVGRLIEAIAQTAPPPALVAGIHRASDGNPFFVGEIAELLRTEWASGAAAPSAFPFRLPDTLRETIQRRVDPLPGATRALLTLGAILGREVELPPLAVAADTTAERALADLEPALAAGLLAPVAERAGRYRFAHALLQHALIDDLPIGERAQLHRRVGEALERVYGNDLPPLFAELAYHFQNSAYTAGLAKAAAYATRAGERAMAALGFEEAAGHFERALQAERAAGTTPAARLALLLKFGEAQRRSGDEDGARATFLEAARLARELDAPEALASAALQYTRARVETGVADRTAIALLEQALSAPGADGAARPYLLAQLASALYFTPHAERREALSLEAVTRARASGDRQALLAALINRHFVLWRPGTVDERLALATEAIGLEHEVDYVEGICEARAWRILDLFELESIDEAERELARLAQDAEALKVPRYRWHVAVARAARALFAGRMTEAETLAGAALQTLRSHAGTNAQPFFAVQLFHLRRMQGRSAELIEAVAALAGTREAALPVWRCAHALLAADVGQDDVARRIVDELAPDRFAVLPLDGNWLPALGALAETCDAIGDAAHAAEVHDLLAPHAGVSVVVGTCAAVLGPVARHLGLAALAAGRPADAVRWFEDAIARCQRLGAPAEEASATLGLARALEARAASGDAARAAALRAQAGATAERLGMSGLLARLGPRRTAPSSLPSEPPRRALLRHEGDYWTVRCGGEVTRLRATKGVGYLELLLRHPGTEFHALDLARGTPGERTPAGDAGEALDEEARRAYRRRLRELDAALAASDPTRAAALRDERATVERELTRGTGFAGRTRRVAADTERARLNVTRALATAVKKIAADCPALGRHLEVAVRTGTFCSYEPDPVFPIVWDL